MYVRWMHKEDRKMWWLILHTAPLVLWGERNGRVFKKEAIDSDKMLKRANLAWCGDWNESQQETGLMVGSDCYLYYD